MSEEAGRLAATLKDSKAPAISRAAAVLRLLGRSATPLSLNTIARDLDLVPSTCLYVLRALVAEELVSFEADTKRYALDTGVLTLARQWLVGNQFTELAQPHLERLAVSFDVTVVAVQIVRLDHFVVVAMAQSAGDFRLSTQVGRRFPAMISATGRCVAAFGKFSEAELERRFRALRWDDPPSFEEWKEQVAQTHRQGYGVDDGNYLAGVTVVAAPVWKSLGAHSHALVATGISGAMKRRGLPRLAEALIASARDLSSQLSAVGSTG